MWVGWGGIRVESESESDESRTRTSSVLLAFYFDFDFLPMLSVNIPISAGWVIIPFDFHSL